MDEEYRVRKTEIPDMNGTESGAFPGFAGPNGKIVLISKGFADLGYRLN